MNLLNSPATESDDFSDLHIDPSIQCSACEATCCRLTVYVMADDPTPEHLIDQDENGMDVMRRLDDGWCTALDRDTMRCTIYSLRPQVCRDFDMGGHDCRNVRENDRLLSIAVL
ncbi:MAG TPA: YkgJ family cysteine cluster protein [Dokdonella sp.]|uniref:YkgJ family cysteine cluster protein n=1 Tax=Dokdonella sp. TaxID=2291710 RepID=UPI002D808BFA|nr:YkgJ family cysteine cluster protein [Dokdonella sp.]HET9032515.1 YkgJ family cysteine cluster protein [Dokdonella sp.]